MCRVRYISQSQHKKELQIKLAKEKQFLEIAPPGRHKTEVKKIIEEIEKELRDMN